ncbi:MAG: DUF554 domain-containing protein [Oscillospiraceae bacterium]|nr:DUF554 domain-containing protein [Oscillospiraceae bacterium]
MIGVIVNTLTVLIGSGIGLLLKKGIPGRVSQAVMAAIGLCTVYIGIDGALSGSNTIVLIVSMVLGTIVGTFLDIDGKINAVGQFFERKFRRDGEKVSVAEGFMTGSLLFCVGAMTIVGSLNSGLSGDHTLIFTKSVLDLISSCMLASSLGIGVMLAAIFVFLFQGALVLGAGLLHGVLTDAALIAEITCAGSVIIVGLGLNILGISKIKVADMLPAPFFVPLIYFLFNLIPIAI